MPPFLRSAAGSGWGWGWRRRLAQGEQEQEEEEEETWPRRGQRELVKIEFVRRCRSEASVLGAGVTGWSRW
jgi:hypothetical protein